MARLDARAAHKSASEAQSEANRVAQDATELQALEWTSQYFDGVRRWGDEVTLVISEAMHLSRIRDVEERGREWNRVRARLSSAIDTGRWYFPNKYQDNFGKEKPLAYRGKRRQILSWVVHAYNSIPNPPAFYATNSKNNDPDTMKAYGNLERYKREFVSGIQQLLNPKQREEQVEKIIERFGIPDRMRIESDDEGNE